MENQEYLNEQQYQQNKKKLKSVGKCLLIVGVVTLVISIFLIIVGFTSFGATIFNGFGSGSIEANTNGIFKNFSMFAIGAIINSFGFILTIAGAITLFIANRREITAYTVQQAMPLAKEGIEKITPTISNAFGEIAKSISKGINEGKK